MFAAMEQEAAVALAEEFGTSEVFFEHHAEMRYRGQRHNIKVPVSGLKDAEQIRAAFERDYKRRYGHADAKAPAEFQALHLVGLRALATAGHRAPAARGGNRRSRRKRRRVYIGNAGGWVDAQIYNRDALVPGFSAAGPAVIEEYGSTTVVWPGDRFEIGELHEIRIPCAAKVDHGFNAPISICESASLSLVRRGKIRAGTT